jgi:hypothetical protein
MWPATKWANSDSDNTYLILVCNKLNLIQSRWQFYIKQKEKNKAKFNLGYWP